MMIEIKLIMTRNNNEKKVNLSLVDLHLNEIHVISSFDRLDLENQLSTIEETLPSIFVFNPNFKKKIKFN